MTPDLHKLDIVWPKFDHSQTFQYLGKKASVQFYIFRYLYLRVNLIFVSIAQLGFLVKLGQISYFAINLCIWPNMAKFGQVGFRWWPLVGSSDWLFGSYLNFLIFYVWSKKCFIGEKRDNDNHRPKTYCYHRGLRLYPNQASNLSYNENPSLLSWQLSQAR